MKAMRALHFVLLATVLFLKLILKLVLFGGLFPPQTANFSPSRSDHPDHPRFVALPYESCIKIGICHSFTPFAYYLYWL
jgi:hypothetical protein